MSEKEIERLKQVAITGSTLPMMLAAVDAIEAYGKDAESTLLDLSASATNPNVATRALEALKRVREKGAPGFY